MLGFRCELLDKARKLKIDGNAPIQRISHFQRRPSPLPLTSWRGVNHLSGMGHRDYRHEGGRDYRAEGLRRKR